MVFTSRIFVSRGPLQYPDDVSTRYEKCYDHLSSLLKGKGEREVSGILAGEMTRNPGNLTTGLVVTIISDNNRAKKFFSYLTHATNDGFKGFVSEVNQLLQGSFQKLLSNVQEGIVWLVREAVRNGVPGVESLCWNLLRNIGRGDVSNENLAIADQVMNIFLENRPWLFNFPQLVSGVMITYLRLIEDHISPKLEMMRKKEVKFVIGLIRERFDDVLTIGRDFVRILMNVSTIPEIETMWHDILFDPSSLHSSFTGVESLLKTPTPKQFIALSISFEVEQKLKWLTENVNFGFQMRYVEWFRQAHLKTRESQSVIADLTRFLVSVIHPSNELLTSDIIPRWALIGELMTMCSNQVTSANLKLSLFFDWLFFDSTKDSIMDIEPGALVMLHSLVPHPQITASLLDCLSRQISHFHPPLSANILQSVTLALKTLASKGVLPRISSLLFNRELSPPLRKSLISTFKTLYEDENGKPRPVLSSEVMVNNVVEANGNPHLPDLDVDDGNLSVGFSDPEDEAEDEKHISDDEQELLIIETPLQETLTESVDPSPELEKLLKLTKNLEGGQNVAKIVEKIISTLKASPVFGEESRTLAMSLANELQDSFDGKFNLESKDGLADIDNDQQVIYALFQRLKGTNKEAIYELLANLNFYQPRLGFFFLCFLFVHSQPTSESMEFYREFCLARETDEDLHLSLVKDLTICQNEDVDNYVKIILALYDLAPEHVLGSERIMYFLISCIDGNHIQNIVQKVVSQELCLFKADSAQPILAASVTWESYEQFAFWQLYNAHELPLSTVLQFIPTLKCSVAESEALTNILLILKKKQPNPDIHNQLMSRPSDEKDTLASSLFAFWMRYCEGKLVDTFVAFLTRTVLKDFNPKKKQFSLGNQDRNFLSNVLSHSELLLRNVSEFFSKTEIKKVYQNIRQHSPDRVRVNHSSFFSRLHSLDTREESSSDSGGGSPPLSPPRKKRRGLAVSSVNYKEQDSSSEEESQGSLTTNNSRKRKILN